MLAAAATIAEAELPSPGIVLRHAAASGHAVLDRFPIELNLCPGSTLSLDSTAALFSAASTRDVTFSQFPLNRLVIRAPYDGVQTGGS